MPSPVFDPFQFALIHGPNIPGSYAVFLFTSSDLASINSHITNGCWFCLGSVLSSFLELFFHWAPVAYWAPTNLRSSSFSVIPFCLFILFMGFSRQEYWSGLPFPSPVDHVLSELSTMTLPSWVAAHSTAHSFIDLDKAVVRVTRLVSFLWLCFSILSALWWRRGGLLKLPEWMVWPRGILGLVLMGGAMLSKSIIQFSVDGWSCVLSLLFTWGQTMVEVMKITVTSLKRSQAWPQNYMRTIKKGTPWTKHESISLCYI